MSAQTRADRAIIIYQLGVRAEQLRNLAPDLTTETERALAIADAEIIEALIGLTK